MKRYLLVTVLFSACYNPKIADGSLACGATGKCPSGLSCDSATNRCYHVLPSPSDAGPNGNDMSPGDMGPDVGFVGSGLLGDVVLTGKSGTLELDSETGRILLNPGGQQEVVVNAGAPGFSHLPQQGGPAVAVWNFARLTIPPTITVRPSSNSISAVALAATNELTIQGPMDWRGYGGLGGGPVQDGQSRGAGPTTGGRGGTADANGAGGGGAGHKEMGSEGKGLPASAGDGGTAYGTPTLMPLHMGSGGGGGGGLNSVGGRGGAGGGAIALFGRTVTIATSIDVSGSVGQPGGSPSAAGGGGGGSGGSILVSGGLVVFDTGHQFLAKAGDGGAGAGGGSNGGAASVGRIWLGWKNKAITGGDIPTGGVLPASVRELT